MTDHTPRVRVVVVNYNGGATTLHCLEQLEHVDWPRDALDVVLVDNASDDGLADVIRSRMPWVRIIRSATNRGFAGGCNLAFADLGAADHIALLNSDASPDRGWLRPLVDALEHDVHLGAACSKVLFASSFVELTVTTDGAAEVAVTGLEIDGRDVFDDAQFREGCDTASTYGAGGSRHCRVGARARIRVPTDPTRPIPPAVRVTLDVGMPGWARVSAGGDPVAVGPGPAQALDVVLRGPRVDVINSAGSCIVAGGYGADRGFLEVDCGQYQESEEVFAWSGAAVLLLTRYLEAVGRFDDDYFMYYEDTDLSWRGQLAGWRYQYVPASVVRHLHAASSREGSALFDHYVERNRLLTLARNAPWPMALEATYRSVRHVFGAAAREGIAPVLKGQRGAMTRSVRHARAIGAFARLLPGALAFRRRQPVSARARAELVARWMR